LYLNPLSLVQKFFGAPLHYCAFCRIQFYDLRPRRAVHQANAAVGPDALKNGTLQPCGPVPLSSVPVGHVSSVIDLSERILDPIRQSMAEATPQQLATSPDLLDSPTNEELREGARKAVRQAASAFFEKHGTSWDHEAWLEFLSAVRPSVSAEQMPDAEIGELLEAEAALSRSTQEAEPLQPAPRAELSALATNEELREEAQTIVRQATREFFDRHRTSWDHQAWLEFLSAVRPSVSAEHLSDAEIGQLLEGEAASERQSARQADEGSQ
jgi:hypothetical protein